MDPRGFMSKCSYISLCCKLGSWCTTELHPFNRGWMRPILLQLNQQAEQHSVLQHSALRWFMALFQTLLHQQNKCFGSGALSAAPGQCHQLSLTEGENLKEVRMFKRREPPSIIDCMVNPPASGWSHRRQASSSHGGALPRQSSACEGQRRAIAFAICNYLLWPLWLLKHQTAT